MIRVIISFVIGFYCGIAFLAIFVAGRDEYGDMYDGLGDE